MTNQKLAMAQALVDWMLEEHSINGAYGDQPILDGLLARTAATLYEVPEARVTDHLARRKLRACRVCGGSGERLEGGGEKGVRWREWDWCWECYVRSI